MDTGDDDEAYVLLLLADSNLPTGSFVASAGLESYVAHGFPAAGAGAGAESKILGFVQDSLGAYARSALPFVSDAHRVVRRAAGGAAGAMRDLVALDGMYEAMTLNHVARRASTAQGVALLTLYAKGFAAVDAADDDTDAALRDLLGELKLTVRRGDTPGHLPVCWGALTAALGLSLERAQYLHLFLHARGVLSAAVRLNDIGPYRAQQLLMHAVRPLIAREAARCRALRSGALELEDPSAFDETLGPANTWPLGEIIAARHDLQHSRIFNS
ncbi:hypothetical protein C0992_003840 [Termitomyces sp. T32_za158]|nr:hypothetical protein C0992_003840 [Termitomyces sp. T32_za158]